MVKSLFDNHYMPEINRSTPSRGLLFYLTLQPDPSVPRIMLDDITAAPPIYSPSQGSYVLLSNGNQLLCYGPIPVVKEFDPEGDLRWEARFGYDEAVQSYRAYKEIWRGVSKDWDPSLYVETVGEVEGHVDETNGILEFDVYVSWNGATEVVSWTIYQRKYRTGLD